MEACKRMHEARMKNEGVDWKVQEAAEKGAVEVEQELREAQKRAREAERKVWIKRAWRTEWNLRAAQNRAEVEENILRDNEERMQRLR
jgi:hypothetical protein